MESGTGRSLTRGVPPRTSKVSIGRRGGHRARRVVTSASLRATKVPTRRCSLAAPSSQPWFNKVFSGAQECSSVCFYCWVPTAQAQLRDSARPPQVSDSQAPSRLDPYRPLREHVRLTDTLTLRSRPRPPLSGDSPQLSQGQKLLWGSVGLVVNAVCESRRDPYETRCERCDRIGDRAARSLLEGMIGSDP